MVSITTTQLHLFYKIDREVFCFLIFNLGHDLTQSLLVVALWLWLEHIGYPSLIPRVMSLPKTIVHALLNEAATCMKSLETDNPTIPSGGGLPLMKKLMQRDISLQIFNLKRYTAIAGIKGALNYTCARIFKDVLQIALNNTSISSNHLVVPGFPHPLFGNFDLSRNFVDLDLHDEQIWTGKGPYDDVTDDERSMFLTFSRGFIVSETEVVNLFKYLYGDCVQSLTMGVINIINEQHLVAVMILKKVETMDEILKGKNAAKFNVNNGKFIWARKYE